MRFQFRYLCSFASLVMCSALCSDAASVTIPTGSFFYAGGPFNDPISATGTTRYQEVFANDAFGVAPAGGILIRGLGFYASSPLTNARFTLTFNLSTTAKEPDGLSSTFADNIGADDTRVFDSLTTVFVSTVDDGQGRNIFEFGLQQPFPYYPQSGNLLLDIRNNDSVTASGSYSSVLVAGDAVSALYQQDLNIPFGVAGTAGLQVRFTYEPVPEPGSIALFILAAGAFWFTRLARRRGKSAQTNIW